MFKFLPNLTSQNVLDLEVPLSADAPQIPASITSKDGYRRWSLEPTTNHIFASHFVGIVETMRVSESNLPFKQVGAIFDFDTRFEGDAIAQIVQNVDPEFRPRYLTRTFSGGIRLWYVFETPILFHDAKVGLKFSDLVIKKLKIRSLFPGFDDKAAKQYGQYFEVGHNWQTVPDSGTIPLVHLEAWMGLAIVAEAGTKKRTGVTIPFEKIRDALELKYPAAWRDGWDKFVVGARGCRFWDGGNATSCIVREDGITCFTGDVGFVSWADLLGREWVEQHTDVAMGEAIENVWFEPSTNKYWRCNTNLGWQQLQKEDLRLHFRMKGIGDDRETGEVTSPMDRVLHQVQISHAVGGAFPFHFRKEDIVMANGQPFLNISRAKLAQPDLSRSGAWGDGFPNLARYYEGFYNAAEFPTQFAHALGEKMWTYRTAFAGNLQRGRVIVHAGPAGVGKTYTLTIEEYIYSILEEASRYLLGQDTFNGSLVAAPIWGVDDPVAAADSRTTATFSQMLKTIAACDNIPVRGMYRESLRLPWVGRVFVNMNDDPESIRMLPSTELSLIDKLGLYLVQRPFEGKFPSNELIKSEIPAFCQFLLEGQSFLESFVPDLFSDPRWGVKNYHHPHLLAIAESAQTSTSVEEFLNLWRKIWFSAQGNTDPFWMGNPTQLMEAIANVDTLRDIQRGVVHGPQALGRALAQLALRTNPPKWLKSHGEKRIYTIYRDDNGPQAA